MSETLLHYSRGPVASLTDKGQVPVGPMRACYFDKPIGLWVSVEGPDDWRSWCEAEGCDFLGGFEHEVVLAPHAQILRMSTVEELYAFTDRYGVPTDLPTVSDLHVWPKAIDWSRIAEQYDGIIIAPYIWGCRLDRDVSWYYTWDCASGCIWRPSRAIAEIKVRNELSTVR